METLKDFETLARFGIFNPEGLHRLAELIRNIQALAVEGPPGGGAEDPSGSVRPRPSVPTGPAASGEAAGEHAGRRRHRGTFNVSREELAELRKTMTGRAIARKFGVSLSTVHNHVRRHGLTRGRGKQD